MTIPIPHVAKTIRYRHCSMKSSYVHFMYLSGETKNIKQLHCITRLVIVFSSKKIMTVLLNFTQRYIARTRRCALHKHSTGS